MKNCSSSHYFDVGELLRGLTEIFVTWSSKLITQASKTFSSNISLFW